MCSVRIGEVARRKYLVRLHLTQQLDGLLNIVFVGDVFGKLSAIVKRKVLKMNVRVGKSHKTGPGNGFSFTDKRFNGTDNLRVDLVRLLALEKLPGFVIYPCCYAFVVVDRLGKILNKLQVAKYVIVPHSRVSRRLVRHMDIVSLVCQTNEGTAH